jgi:hypothetical protein
VLAEVLMKQVLAVVMKLQRAEEQAQRQVVLTD